MGEVGDPTVVGRAAGGVGEAEDPVLKVLVTLVVSIDIGLNSGAAAGFCTGLGRIPVADTEGPAVGGIAVFGTAVLGTADVAVFDLNIDGLFLTTFWFGCALRPYSPGLSVTKKSYRT